LSNKLGSGLGEAICVGGKEVKLIACISGRVEADKEGNRDNDGVRDDKKCRGKCDFSDAGETVEVGQW